MRPTAARVRTASATQHSAGVRARTLTFARHHRLLLGLIACYIAFGFAASLFTPPWQSPDEPAHFEHAMLTPYGTDAELPEVQQPILRTFDEYRFYEYRRLRTPANDPESFRAIDWAIIRQVGKTPLYYQLAWLAASWTDNTILQLYSMRWLSVIFSALTIPLVYATVRELLPTNRAMLAFLAAAFVALLPMYGYIGASVNPDTIGAPIAAASVLFAVRALRSRQVVASLTLMVVTATLAVFVRRSSVVLLPWACFVVLWVVLPQFWRRLPRSGVVAGFGVSLAVFVAIAFWPSRLAADWYPDPKTRSSLANGGFEGQQAFALAAHADGTASLVSYQIPRHQIAQLQGTTLTIAADVRGEPGQASGQIMVSSQSSALASAPVVPTLDWHPLMLQVHVPNDAQTLFITLSGSGSSALYFDAIRASRGLAGEPIALSNGGAEYAYTWWQARFLSQSFADYTARIAQAVRLGTYISPQAWELYPWYLGNLSSSFIGRFGWMAIGLPAWLEHGLRLLGLILVCALPLAWRRGSALEPNQRRTLLLLALLLFGGVFTLLLEYTPYLSAVTFPQGRYLFPFLAPIAALLLGGLSQLIAPRFDRMAVLVGTGGLLALYLWCWFGLIIPYFYA